MKCSMQMGLMMMLLITACMPQQAPIQQQIPTEKSVPEQLPIRQQPPIPSGEPNVKIFTVIASQWDFEPNTLQVEKGDRVIIKVTSVDVDHGLAIQAFNVSINVRKGETQTIEFVADRAGTFAFSCSVYCGQGHSRMKGILVVNEP